MNDWRDNLSEKQYDEVELAHFYTNKLAHDLACYQPLALIDHLAKLLDAADSPSPPPPLTVLNVPYHSQHEADAKRFRRDCGPACIEMIGEWYHPDTDITTDSIMEYITDGSDRSIWIKELQDAALYCYGVALGRHDALDWDALRMYVVEDCKPAIVLVHYGSFATRMDRNYTVGHYLVVAGFDEIKYQDETIERIIVHDPDFYSGIEAQGAFIPIVRSHFLRMWDSCHLDGNPDCMALVPIITK